MAETVKIPYNTKEPQHTFAVEGNVLTIKNLPERDFLALIGPSNILSQYVRVIKDDVVRPAVQYSSGITSVELGNGEISIGVSDAQAVEVVKGSINTHLLTIRTQAAQNEVALRTPRLRSPS